MKRIALSLALALFLGVVGTAKAQTAFDYWGDALNAQGYRDYLDWRSTYDNSDPNNPIPGPLSSIMSNVNFVATFGSDAAFWAGQAWDDLYYGYYDRYQDDFYSAQRALGTAYNYYWAVVGDPNYGWAYSLYGSDIDATHGLLDQLYYAMCDYIGCPW